MGNLSILISFVVLIFSANITTEKMKPGKCTRKCSLRKSFSNEELKLWKKDKFGCKAKRPLLTEQIHAINFDEHSKKCIFSVLGRPDSKINGHYFYYLASKCINRKMDINSDKILLEFRFNEENTCTFSSILIN